MQLIIDGKCALLKKGTSFDFIAENRSFSSADSYTLSISLPLAGCPENIAIFGHLNRMDTSARQVKLDAAIIDRAIHRYGVVTVVESSETEIKCQFLEGRSAQNFDDTLEEIYINELNLGAYPTDSLPNDPSTQWMGLRYGQEAVALPWVNNSSGNIQNEVVYANNAYTYHADCKGLSYQPYLIVIAKRICDAIGYEYDFTDWERKDDLRYLLICNTLPWAWEVPQFARALPHWNVAEFFEKLEPLLGCEFDIDHKAKKIKFASISSILSNAKPIRLEKVVDSFTVNVTTADESNYIESANRHYKECNHNMWKFYSCPWFIKENAESKIVYDTLDALIAENATYARLRSYGRGMPGLQNILYAKDVDTHFVIRCIRTEYVETNSLGDVYDRIHILQPINVFGDKIVDENSDNDIELDFVPAWIDETDPEKGNCLFLEVASYSEDLTSGGTRPGTDSSTSTNDKSEVVQPGIVQRLLEGEKEAKTEYYDKIFVAFWDGAPDTGKFPSPTIDWITIREDWTYFVSQCSLRFSLSPMAQPIYKINPKQKFHISFLSDDIPNVRSLFFIKGKAFVCEKITATFTEDGMSQLLKGEFYLLDE